MTEICSRHCGKIGVTTKDGRPVKVDFRDVSDKGGPAMGVAQVEDDAVAEALLSIGRPDYWRTGEAEPKESDPDASPDDPKTEKTGSSEDPEKTKAPENPESPEGDKGDEGGDGPDPAAPLTVEKYKGISNAKELAAALEACDDQKALMEVIAFESQQETVRKTWMDALSKRLGALQKG